MQSGRWYYVPKRKTNYANSIIPFAIRLLNGNWFLLSTALFSQWKVNVCVCVTLVGILVSKYVDVNIYFFFSFYSLCVNVF